ncbi:MAG: PIN domain-containing protein [Actinobacteria bacterium]|nr:PIN domain-containing protein [Actinomycetota bacterium]
MIVLDTSGLFSAADAGQPAHDRVSEALRAETGPFILSPFVLAEVDYFITSRISHEIERAFLADVSAGAYELARFDEADLGAAVRVLERYVDLRIGLADASIVVLAERYGTERVLTLDERHFRALRTLDGRPFTLLPADA